MACIRQMPALGESVTEGTVTRWLKQEGDTVEVDEPLLEVSTDKVDTEIPSPAAGVLQRIVAGEDETVEVGGELAVIGDGGDGSDAADRRAPARRGRSRAAQRGRRAGARPRPRRARGGARQPTPRRSPTPRAARGRPPSRLAAAAGGGRAAGRHPR